MDDLIYILAAIAWIVYAFYRNSKKVKKNIPGQSKPASQEGQKDFKTLLEEMLAGEVEPKRQTAEPVWDTVEKEAWEPEAAPSTNEWFKETSPYFTMENQSLEGQSLEAYDEVPSKSVEDAAVFHEKSHAGGWLFKEDFSLRKAVIYSAIINRPYS